MKPEDKEDDEKIRGGEDERREKGMKTRRRRW
jgi:hypothetical protein